MVSSNHLIILGAIFVALLVIAEFRQIKPLKWLTKTAASLTFVWLALINGAALTPFGQAILAGLVFSAAGDVFLLSRRDAAFLAGMAAFAIGHLAYTFAFIQSGATLTLASLTLGAVAIAGCLLTLRYLWPHLGHFRIPVIGYVAIIGAMVFFSLAAAETGNNPLGWRFAGAAILFAVSDIAVARDQFIVQNAINKLWGLPLYYAAQFLFATSV